MRAKVKLPATYLTLKEIKDSKLNDLWKETVITQSHCSGSTRTLELSALVPHWTPNVVFAKAYQVPE